MEKEEILNKYYEFLQQPTNDKMFKLLSVLEVSDDDLSILNEFSQNEDLTVLFFTYLVVREFENKINDSYFSLLLNLLDKLITILSIISVEDLTETIRRSLETDLKETKDIIDSISDPLISIYFEDFVSFIKKVLEVTEYSEFLEKIFQKHRKNKYYQELKEDFERGFCPTRKCLEILKQGLSNYKTKVDDKTLTVFYEINKLAYELKKWDIKIVYYVTDLLKSYVLINLKKV